MAQHPQPTGVGPTPHWVEMEGFIYVSRTGGSPHSSRGGLNAGRYEAVFTPDTSHVLTSTVERDGTVIRVFRFATVEYTAAFRIAGERLWIVQTAIIGDGQQ